MSGGPRYEIEATFVPGDGRCGLDCLWWCARLRCYVSRRWLATKYKNLDRAARVLTDHKPAAPSLYCVRVIPAGQILRQ